MDDEDANPAPEPRVPTVDDLPILISPTRSFAEAPAIVCAFQISVAD